jgi:gamma-glutamyltranspeptidase/glutathione hydrolase
VIGFPSTDAQPFDWPRRRVAPALARHGMVASSHPLVTGTGLRTLAAGGNAVDAAVASGLVAAVVMPEMCGLGGDLFALVYDPSANGGAGQVRSIQGSGIAPRGASREAMRHAHDGVRMPANGPLSVTVPGMVHAYFTLLEQWGSRSFGELVEPAIDYARGHAISPVLVSFIAKFADLLGRLPATANVFLPGGRPPDPGSIFRQEDLARTLEAVAAGGADVFYKGEIAERISAYLAEVGGALRTTDFADHTTTVSAPLSTTFRDHTVYQTALPSQGIILLEALNIAECFDLPALGVGSAAATHVLAEAIRLAFADRHAYLQDPATGDSPVDQLLSKDWARARAARIGDRAMTDVAAGDLDDGHTTYLNVVDGNGMMVSLIQSVAANFGSGVVAGDTGVVLNNRASAFSLDDRHPNVYAPGKKPMHTLNCYLIADPAGRLVVTGGTPGGDRQPQWNLQTVVGLVDGGWDAQQTVEQPLWFSSTPFGVGPASGLELTLEGRVGEEYAQALRDRGHTVTVDGDWSCLSGAQVIARDPETGVLAGGSDPRQEGLALGY